MFNFATPERGSVEDQPQQLAMDEESDPYLHTPPDPAIPGMFQISLGIL